MTLKDIGGGRWRARAYVGRDPATGRKMRPSHVIVASTEEDARRKADEWLGTVEPRKAGVPASLGRMLDDWVAGLEERGARGNTVAAHRQSRARIGRTGLATKPYLSVTPADVARAMDELAARGSATGGPLSASTVKATLTTLSAAYRDWVRLGWADDNPVRGVRPPRGSSRSPRARSLQQMELAAMQSALSSEAKGDGRGAAFARPLLLVLNSGMRLGEALALRVGDIDLSDRGASALVSATMVTKPRLERQAAAKTLSGERRVAVSDGAALADAVALRVSDGAGPEDPLFPSPAGGWMSADLLWPWFRDFRASHGLPSWATPHVLRHTYASQALAAGQSPVSVQLQLGHASWSTTLSVYGHEVQGQQRALADAMGERYRRALEAYGAAGK